MAFCSRALFIRACAPRSISTCSFTPLYQTASSKFSSKASSIPESITEESTKVNDKLHDFASIPGWDELKSTPFLTELEISRVKLDPSEFSQEKTETERKKSKNKFRRVQRYKSQSVVALSEVPPVSSPENGATSGHEENPEVTDVWSFLVGENTKPTRRTAQEPKARSTDPNKLSNEPWRAQKERINKVKKASGIQMWDPLNRITLEEQFKLKKLRAEDSAKWNIRALSKEFMISPEAVSRIIKSRYRSPDLRPLRLAKAAEKEEAVDPDEWAKLSEEEKDVLQMIDLSNKPSLANQGEEYLDENDPFGDLDTVDSDDVKAEPRTIERKWEEGYEKIASYRQRNKEHDEERAKIRNDLWGWQPLKADKRRKTKKVKPVEVEAETVAVEKPIDENLDPTSANSTFNWVLALQNKKKTP